MPTSAAQFRTADTDRRGWRQCPTGSISHHRCACFRTQRLPPADPSPGPRRTPRTTKNGASKEKSWESLRVRLQSSRVDRAAWRWRALGGSWKRARMFSLRAGGRRRSMSAVKLIGRNVTGVRGDAANLDDLDRLFDAVKREKGRIDVLYASA